MKRTNECRCNFCCPANLHPQIERNPHVDPSCPTQTPLPLTRPSCYNAAMRQSLLCSEPHRAPAAEFVGNSRRGELFLDACMLQVEGHVSRERRWGWDGACLEWTVASSNDPISYRGGMNLYEYVGDSPLTRTDPTGLENFYVCGQVVGAGAGIKRCCARTCGCNHYDIYGDESGNVYQGWDGGVTGSKEKVPTGPGWKCYPLKRATTTVIPIPSPVPVFPIVEQKKISWGPAKGKSCKEATAADVLACLQGKPKRTGDPGMAENCQTDSYDAAEGCCLTGFRPATIIPLPPSSY